MVRRTLGAVGKSLQRSGYAYANARVRVRRSRLLASDSYAKLLKMDVAEITRFLDGGTYGTEINELASAFAGIDLLEGALSVNLEREFAEIRGFSKGEVGALVRRYLDRWINKNVKTVLRGRSYGAAPAEIIKDLMVEGRADYDFFNRLIQAEGTSVRAVADALAADPRGAEAAQVLRDAESRTDAAGLALQVYEDALDRAYYENLLKTIQPHSQENTLFLQFVRKEIDAKNLQTLLRLKKNPDPSDVAVDHLIMAGYSLTPADLRRLGESTSLLELVERIKEFPVYQEIRDELDAVTSDSSLTPVLVALTRGVGAFAQRFSYRNPLSVLPVINYFMRKELEVRNLRAIARGKQAKLSEEAIEALLVVI